MFLKVFLISVLLGVVSYQYFAQEIFINLIEPLLKSVVKRSTFIFNFIGPFVHELTRESQADRNSSFRIFTTEELKTYVGDKNNGKLYLAILGKVFDVTKGKRFYGPGEAYHAFTGKDASKAFITGDFSETGLTDDITDLSLSDLSGLLDWLKKYQTDYQYKGVLIGRFYDSKGEATPYLLALWEKFSAAEKLKEIDDEYFYKYPPCNVEWNPETGSKVWCSKLSGGVKRDWIGVPRKFYQAGKTSYRCACVQERSEEAARSKERRWGSVEPYLNCDPGAASCRLVETLSPTVSPGAGED